VSADVEFVSDGGALFRQLVTHCPRRPIGIFVFTSSDGCPRTCIFFLGKRSRAAGGR
jgi:hypothetical protein